METISLGKTKMVVSKLGFGGIPIQRLTENEAVAVIRKCLDLGITFLDTANGYSTSEERIGKAIKGRRDGLILATKSVARTREEVAKHLKLSLKHLGVDYIDLYQFHDVSTFDHLDKVIHPDGTMAVVEEAKKEGVIGHIGITSHSMDVAKKAVETDCFETIMFPFNFVTSEPAVQLLPLAREHDVGFIAMKPLAGGMLSNATIAFKYLFQFPDIVPIPGIEKVEEIEEIVQILAGSWEMTKMQMQEMQRLKDELGTKFCRRCDYCQPCSEEIPISTVMINRSFFKRLPPERFFSGMVDNAMEKAANCTECGECEAKCPYHLPIMNTIAENTLWYQEEKQKYQARGTTKSD